MRKIAVVGAGLAGMVAAIAAQREGVEVLLVDRGSVGLGTNSAMANGVFAGPTSSYGETEYVADTLRIGREINGKTMVEAAARGIGDGIALLRSMGLDIGEGVGSYAVRSPDPNVIPGVTLVKKVAEAVGSLPRISVVAGFYVTELLKDRGSVCGIRGLDKRGQEADVRADAVVLATGGAGAVYLKNDNQKRMMGQGYRIAARAGLALWDMEFVQYYPLVFADPHLPSMIVFPPYDNAVELRNTAGEDLVAKYSLGNINEAVVKKRDSFSAILFQELQSGPVLMDFRKVPTELWGKHPLSLLAKLKYDFAGKPVAVSPATHFFMGGVRTDGDGRTELPGLFACGEVVAGLHGANRRGGNALTECIVFGRAAGRSAALYVRENKAHRVCEPAAAPAAKSGARGDLRLLRQEIRELAWKNAAVVRTEEGMTEGLAAIRALRRRLEAWLPPAGQERKLKLDLDSAAFTVQAILAASLGRQESRGGFLRGDFPDEDNVRWKTNSCLRYDDKDDTFTLSFENIG